MSKRKDKIILIDADVIIHFIKGSQIYSLNSIFPFEIRLLDKVYAELAKYNKSMIDNLIVQSVLTILDFPEDNQEIKKEYFHIKKKLFKGDGESACLAYARFNNDIIASSNLKDIRDYCSENNITFLTTMDFLCEALKIGHFTLAECNAFISSVLSKGSKLPVKKMEDFTCTEFEF